MAIDTTELERLNQQYRDLTGQRVRRFICPITLQDRPDGELCDGHVLNQSLVKASRVHVIQYKDVDNYFGHTIEPHLVKWLNLPATKPEDLIQQAKTLKITGPNGEKIETFWSTKAAREKFQQIDLYRPDGTTFASPFLKNATLPPSKYNQMEIVWNITLSNASILGSLLKAAYLAMFRMMGYAWVLDPAGDKIRRTLNAFLNEPKRQFALEQFREFYRANSMMFNREGVQIADTLDGSTMLIHYANGDRINGDMFAITLLFNVNNRLTTITLPWYEKPGHYCVSFALYQQFLANRSMPHNVYWGRHSEGRFEIEPKPTQLFLADGPNPNEGPLFHPWKRESRRLRGD